MEAAVRAALDRFGRIDALVNNAGNFFAGFEELSPEQFEQQLTTNLVTAGVTRAVLPRCAAALGEHHHDLLDRRDRRTGVLFCQLRLEVPAQGWNSLRFEVEPFGMDTTIVEPGFFRTELLRRNPPRSGSVDRGLGRAHRRNSARREAMSGKQSNDPAEPRKRW